MTLILSAIAPSAAAQATRAGDQTPSTGALAVPGLHLVNGWLVANGRVVWGYAQHNGWWRPGLRANITRRDPRVVGPNRTEDLDKLTDNMLRFAYPGFEHNYGLWYDRRRDQHDTARRADGNVVAPFLEQPWARSKSGAAWDGLPRYDLTQYNSWYFERLREFASLCDRKGAILFHNFYMQHALLETDAHYVDFPWRPVNCVQNTGMPDRIPAANTFYDVTDPVRRGLHRAYIRKCLDELGDHTNVVHLLSEEYTGPAAFARFWLDVIMEWQQEKGKKVLVGLGGTKDVLDELAGDPRVSVLDLRYWWYQPDGSVVAPAGGTQVPGRYALGSASALTTPPAIYRQVREYRRRYPGKGLIHQINASGQQTWAFLMGGGSMLIRYLQYTNGRDPVDYQAPAGQIVVDPAHPAWFKYQDGGPFYMCGPGDPEGFLYRGTRNANGTRNGDQMTLINKLVGTGANCIYLMAIRSHGGDGDATHNPYIDGDLSKGLDDDILNQWETWFTAMNNNGIVIFFIFYDDSASPFGKDLPASGQLKPEEVTFVNSMVSRFKKYKRLIWCVAEEYAEGLSAAHAIGIAQQIKLQDNLGHPVAIHQNNGTSFAFNGDPSFNQFAVQWNVTTAAELHAGTIAVWNNVGGLVNVNMAEFADAGTGAVLREKIWSIAMGGGYSMILEMDIASTPLSDLQICGRLVGFMEATRFNEAAPHDELAGSDTDYVLARPGEVYIAYSDSGGRLGLLVEAGSYRVRWFNPVSGDWVDEEPRNLKAGEETFARPAGFADEAVLDLKAAGVPETRPAGHERPSRRLSLGNEWFVHGDGVVRAAPGVTDGGMRVSGQTSPAAPQTLSAPIEPKIQTSLWTAYRITDTDCRPWDQQTY